MKVILFLILPFIMLDATAQTYDPRVSVVTPPPSNSADLYLNSKVNEQIRTRVRNFASENYSIFSQAGQVTVQGRAGSKSEAEEILSAARLAPGVSSVVNAITVNPVF